MVATIKFSQFAVANFSTDTSLVGFGGGLNVKSDVPITWTVATRPLTPNNGLLGFNTDLQAYEFWDAATSTWIQLAENDQEIDWINVTGTSAPLAPGMGFLANNAGLVTLTLPLLCVFGGTFDIAGFGTGGFTIQANPGQNIIYGDIAGGSGGSLSSTNQYDQVNLLCGVANTTFIVRPGSIGELLIV